MLVEPRFTKPQQRKYLIISVASKAQSRDNDLFVELQKCPNYKDNL